MSNNNFNEIFGNYKKFMDNRKKMKTKHLSKKQIMNEKKIYSKNNNLSFAIIVPYRDNLDGSKVRYNQMLKFIKYMPTYLNKLGKKFEYKIIIIEQANHKKFNRGRLLNIGFLLSKHKFNYFIFHDIDLIPNIDLLHYYGCYPSKPIHLASVWDKYTKGSFSFYFGGVNSFNKTDFEAINGYPNDYWGWGGEDDELYNRVVDSKLEVICPKDGKYQEEEHEKPTKDEEFPFKEKLVARLKHKDWKTNGLNEVKYKIIKDKTTNEYFTILNKHSYLISVDFS